MPGERSQSPEDSGSTGAPSPDLCLLIQARMRHWLVGGGGGGGGGGWMTLRSASLASPAGMALNLACWCLGLP